jgi:hypothetical protein
MNRHRGAVDLSRGSKSEIILPSVSPRRSLQHLTGYLCARGERERPANGNPTKQIPSKEPQQRILRVPLSPSSSTMRFSFKKLYTKRIYGIANVALGANLIHERAEKLTKIFAFPVRSCIQARAMSKPLILGFG